MLCIVEFGRAVVLQFVVEPLGRGVNGMWVRASR